MHPFLPFLRRAARWFLARRAAASPFVIAVVLASVTTLVRAQETPSFEPPPASFRPRVEHAVSDFTFRMNDADPKTSTLDGRLLSNEIMRA